MKRERTIEMTLLQRIGLENLLGEQRGKREDNRVLYNIRRKIRVSPEERNISMRPLANGQFMFDEIAAAGMPTIPVVFTDDETRRLIKLGDTLEIPVGIMDWFEPLLQELEAKEPAGVTEMPA